MRAAVRIALVALGSAAVSYGLATLTGGLLGVPSRRPFIETYELDSPELDLDRPSRSVTPLGWSIPWFVRTEQVWVDLDAICMVRGPRRATPVQFVTTTIGPRPGLEWISGGVAAAGLALAAFGSWPRRRATTPTP